MTTVATRLRPLRHPSVVVAVAVADSAAVAVAGLRGADGLFVLILLSAALVALAQQTLP